MKKEIGILIMLMLITGIFSGCIDSKTENPWGKDDPEAKPGINYYTIKSEVAQQFVATEEMIESVTLFFSDCESQGVELDVRSSMYSDNDPYHQSWSLGTSSATLPSSGSATVAFEDIYADVTDGEKYWLIVKAKSEPIKVTTSDEGYLSGNAYISNVEDSWVKLPYDIGFGLLYTEEPEEEPNDPGPGPESPEGEGTYILTDRLAQSVKSDLSKISNVKLYFKDCEGQIVKLTTEQTYGSNKPSASPIIYDSITTELPSSGDYTCVFSGFNSVYPQHLYYWLQLHLVSGSPLKVYYSDEPYTYGSAVQYDNGWNFLQKDLAFDVQWTAEAPEEPPEEELIELTFASSTSVDADLHPEKFGSLHSYVLDRSYRIWRVKVHLDHSSSGAYGFILAMQYTHTGGLGGIFHDETVNLGHSYEWDLWADQSLMEYKLVGHVFQTYFAGGSYNAYGTIYVSEDCRYWEDC